MRVPCVIYVITYLKISMPCFRFIDHYTSVFTVVVNRLFDKRYYLFINNIIITIMYFFFCLFNFIVGFCNYGIHLTLSFSFSKRNIVIIYR